MPNSFLQPEGLFNPALRFAFTNITDEVFVSYWDKIPITVKPHETIELGPTTPIIGAGHALAVKMTCELVDKIIMAEAKMDELEHSKEPYYRSPKSSSLGVPMARKVYEDKILRELLIDEESPAIQQIRQQLKKEIVSQGDENRVKPVPTPTSINEFADLTKKTEEKPKLAAKVKKIKVQKVKNETINPTTN